MKKINFPTAHTILLLIAAFVAVLTWIVPAGTYDTLMYSTDDNNFVISNLDSTYTMGATQESLEQLNIKIPLNNFTSGAIYKAINIPKTYQQIEPKPQEIVALIMAPLKGIEATIDIILLVLIIGGLIGIVNATGAFEAGISWLANALKGREFILIILVTSLIALGGTTFGLAEETIAFYPILIPIFLAAKYDALVATACIYIGSTIGTMIATTNPFSVIIASNAAGINWTTGLAGRIVMLLVGLVICLIYIIRYAQKVKKDPSKSIIYDQYDQIAKMFPVNLNSDKKLTYRLKLVLLIFGTCFVVMVYGVMQLEWWFMEMTSVFFVGALLIGFITKFKESEFVDVFMKGAGDLLSVAFIIGIARGVTVLMDDGNISDTLLYYASNATEGMHKGLFANTMLFIYSGLSFFIPSSSGMAVLTMPIMSPLADGVGVGREIVINAYLFGMGLFAFINPTGIILASLAIVKVGFDKWLKFVTPLVIILAVVFMVAITISVYL
ncbi:MAG: hypothetical protein BM563_11020 [Bacteroidetes bacterium MedPE-SWsnd-G1]|nr:MAG: hypothetical protein BM563_11020 [Bacteroidetes bacterium MedPE-SWsnd-G1]